MTHVILTENARIRTDNAGLGGNRSRRGHAGPDAGRTRHLPGLPALRVAVVLALTLGMTLGLDAATPARAAASGAASASAGVAALTGSASDCALLTPSRSRAGVELPGRPGRVTLALATRYKTSHVRVTHCVRTANGTYAEAWRSAGRIGRNGLAPPGTKREGDGRSPVGVFTLPTAFGAGNPGTRLPYLRLRPDSCWGSTVGSARYNRYFRGRCGPADESMHRYVRGAYAQGLVVSYNTDPIRHGRGSAIFVHATTGRATAGCVSLPLRRITQLVKATRPGDAIVMGVRGLHTPRA